jgi:type IV pilus assembly protein PilP
MQSMSSRRILLLAAGLSVAACDANPALTAVPPQAAPTAASAPQAAPAAAAVAPETSSPTYRDTDFVEDERNRDPFRSFVSELRGKTPIAAQRAVIMPNTPIDAMRLIAIISGINQPRAMLVDEKGIGYVTARGDFVGKADVVQGGGTENIPITLNWRVDRIRENEIVVAREDPSAPNRPPLTKVIPMRDAKDPELTAMRPPTEESPGDLVMDDYVRRERRERDEFQKQRRDIPEAADKRTR